MFFETVDGPIFFSSEDFWDRSQGVILKMKKKEIQILEFFMFPQSLRLSPSLSLIIVMPLLKLRSWFYFFYFFFLDSGSIFRFSRYVTSAMNFSPYLNAYYEHCSANAEATGSNPVDCAPKNFFPGYFAIA